jgi:asparagine synthase (glutamine-hydrolysing)
MCGISAMFTKAPDESIARTVMSSMEIARHRGPDGSGAIFGLDQHLWRDEEQVAPNWGIGHVRLAILDTSSAGHQPMSYCNEAIWITYNGEVYNYVELRQELARLGYPFHTGTDTEVILASYDHWGEDCVQYFRGMFAFVLVDIRRRLVFAARDRLGIKPLYFWGDSRVAMIVSEPKQLQACQQFRPVADRQQIADYLVDGVVGHNADRTFFQNVQPLPHAHTVSWTLGELPDLRKARRYWTPSTTSRQISWDDAVSETRRLFIDAVELRLRSDVPLGACLSGGIDSSSLVCTITKHFRRRICTFSTCWNDRRFDEQEFMDPVNRHCDAIPAKVFPSVDDAIREFEELVYFHDEPVGSFSQYAQYCVMRTARENGITVVLDGQGGDEALCGYRKYSFFYLRRLLSQGRLGPAVWHALSALRSGDPRLLHFHLGQRYLPTWLRTANRRLKVVFRPGWGALLQEVWSQRMRTVHSLHDHQLADLEVWSLPALLRYEDRNSMAHGLEARVPFVDHVFVEHCLTLPEGYFYRNGRSKRLLTEAMGTALPPILHSRRCKRGFDTPLPVWMQGEWGKYLEGIVGRSERIDVILNRREVTNAFREYRQGSRRFSDLDLFRIACLAHWLETFRVSVTADDSSYSHRLAA